MGWDSNATSPLTVCSYQPLSEARHSSLLVVTFMSSWPIENKTAGIVSHEAKACFLPSWGLPRGHLREHSWFLKCSSHMSRISPMLPEKGRNLPLGQPAEQVQEEAACDLFLLFLR